jgi:DNA-directed RNA polymerase specialized sigma24 family protein
VLAARKKDWTLTQEAFERLLAALDGDRERAGQRYENMRRKLIEFFEARGSHSPNDHADETINRVARRLDEGESVQDLSAYFYGVARLLLKETLRARGKEPIALDSAPPPPVGADDEEHERRRQEEDRRLQCFEVCLSKLPAASRVFIVEYYREEKGVKIEQRKRQANALNMSLNALRLRACRIRAELGDCITTCLDRSPETRNQSLVTD